MLFSAGMTSLMQVQSSITHFFGLVKLAKYPTYVRIELKWQKIAQEGTDGDIYSA